MNTWGWVVLFICSAVVLVTIINRVADHVARRPARERGVGDMYGQ